jgi:hypothetical protein
MQKHFIALCINRYLKDLWFSAAKTLFGYRPFHSLFSTFFFLQVSLTYHPAKNMLTIAVLKAKNLKAKDINGKSGEYYTHK